MSPLVVTILVGLIAGVAVGVQGPLAGLMSNRIGFLESAFYIHLTGAIAAGLLLLLFFRGGNLAAWRDVPWYALWAGALGVIVISGMSFLIPRVGVAPATVLIVAAQITVGVVLDQFGWLDAAVRPLEWQRGLGLLLVFLGVWLAVR
jgi:transporter family-2 protein